MPLRYTTTVAIERRLRGRLQLSSSTPAFGTNLGAGQIDSLLIEQIGTQVETKLDSALSVIYELPISPGATSALVMLASIVEKLVVSEIVGVHYQGSINSELGGDGGFGALLRKQALEELQALLVGHGIYIPGLVTPQSIPGANSQPLVLPGVKLRTSNIPDTISRSQTLIGKRIGGKAQDIDWGV